MVLEFLDDIKSYLKQSIISLDSDFTDLEVLDAYTAEHIPNKNEIAVYLEDMQEDNESNSYDKENLSICILNIYCYAKATKLGTDTTKTSANRVATKLGEDVKKVMDKNLLQNSNANVISSTRSSYTGAMPLEESSLYVSILRYEIRIKNDYTISNNQ